MNAKWFQPHQRWFVYFCLWLLAQGVAPAQSLSEKQLADIRFDQNLNTQLALDLPFRDERGNHVTLRNYFGEKPVILVLGYYECPMLCTLVLNGMVEALQDVKWTIGQQFEVVNISIDPREGPSLAAAKKLTYVRRYGRKGAAEGWHFLTGDAASVQRIADQVGFHFLYDSRSGQFAHPSGLVFLTPQGKVAGYRFGVAYEPKQVMESLRQAESGKPGSPVHKLILLCFHYSPISGKYGAAIMLGLRILAVLTILGLVWVIYRTARRAQTKVPNAGTGEPVAGGARK